MEQHEYKRLTHRSWFVLAPLTLRLTFAIEARSLPVHTRHYRFVHSKCDWGTKLWKGTCKLLRHDSTILIASSSTVERGGSRDIRGICIQSQVWFNLDNFSPVICNQIACLSAIQFWRVSSIKARPLVQDDPMSCVPPSSLHVTSSERWWNNQIFLKEACHSAEKYEQKITHRIYMLINAIRASLVKEVLDFHPHFLLVVAPTPRCTTSLAHAPTSLRMVHFDWLQSQRARNERASDAHRSALRHKRFPARDAC